MYAVNYRLLDRSLISDNGCTHLADALTNNTTLQSLDLYYNDITPLGATALSRQV
jgi:hypothetical protein